MYTIHPKFHLSHPHFLPPVHTKTLYSPIPYPHSGLSHLRLKLQLSHRNRYFLLQAPHLTQMKRFHPPKFLLRPAHSPDKPTGCSAETAVLSAGTYTGRSDPPADK